MKHIEKPNIYIYIYIIYTFFIWTCQITIIKTRKKESEKKHTKNIKIFWRRKRQMVKTGLRKISKYFWGIQEQKQKLLEYTRNYYLTHKKQLLSHLIMKLRTIKITLNITDLLCYAQWGNFWIFFLEKKIFNLFFFSIALSSSISHYNGCLYWAC